MKKTQSALAMAALLVLAMAPSAVRGQDQVDQVRHYTFHHAGIQRHYALFVPSGYTPNTSMPLVLAIHGGQWNDMRQMMACEMNAVAEREGFLVAYPDAVSGAWYGGDRTDPYDDIGYIEALVRHASTLYTVDASRVYAAGFSEGAIMSYILSVELPYTFAAIAPVAGVRAYLPGTDLFFPLGVPATPSRPFPVLHIHGTADSMVPYNGGETYGWKWPGCEQEVGDYAANNGCKSTPTVVDLPDVDPTDGTTVQLLTCGKCGSYVDSAGNTRQAEALLYRVVNGGHNWPSDFHWVHERNLPVTGDINASEEIWKFFSRHVVAVP